MASLTEKIKSRLFFNKSEKKFKFSRDPENGYTALNLDYYEHRSIFHWWALYPFTNPDVNVSAVLSNLNRDSTWTWVDETGNGNFAGSAVEITVNDVRNLLAHTQENWKNESEGYIYNQGTNYANNFQDGAPSINQEVDWIPSFWEPSKAAGWISMKGPFGRYLDQNKGWLRKSEPVPQAHLIYVRDAIIDYKATMGAPFMGIFGSSSNNILKNYIRATGDFFAILKAPDGNPFTLRSFNQRVSGYMSVILNGLKDLSTVIEDEELGSQTIAGNISPGVITSKKPDVFQYLAADEGGVITPSDNALEEVRVDESIQQFELKDRVFITTSSPTAVVFGVSVGGGSEAEIVPGYPVIYKQQRVQGQGQGNFTTEYSTTIRNKSDLFGNNAEKRTSVNYSGDLTEEQSKLWSSITNPSLQNLDIEIADVAEIYGDNPSVQNLEVFNYSTSFKKIKLEFEEPILQAYADVGVQIRKKIDDNTREFTFAVYFNNAAYNQALVLTRLLFKQYAFDRRQDYFDIFVESVSGELEGSIEDAKEAAQDSQKRQAEKDVDEAAQEEAKQEAKRIEQIQRFFNQCMLLANMDNLQYNYYDRIARMHNHKFGIHEKDIYGGRYFNVVSMAPQTTLNKIKIKNSYYTDIFNNITPNIQSHLVPYMKIEKVFINDEGRTATTEIPFENFPRQHNTKDRPLDYLRRSQANGFINKGGHVGLESMTFNFDGETPATAEKYVTCNMSISFTDFRTLFEERNTYTLTTDGNGKITREEDTFRYIDLVVNPIDKTKTPLVPGSNKMDHYDPTYYRIKVTVGWSMTENSEYLGSAVSNKYSIPEINKSLEEVKEVFMMCSLDHELDIQKDGSVNLKISLRGYGDTMARSNRFNALVSQAQELEIQTLQKDFQKLINEGKCTVAQRSEFSAAIDAVRADKADYAFQNILRRLVEMKATHVGFLDEEQKNKADLAKKDFKDKGTFTFRPPIKTSLQNEAKDKFNGASITPRGNLYECTYFYFGDLMYALMDCMFFDEGDRDPALGADNIRYILTDFSYKKFLPEEPKEKLSDTSDINMPMAAIPITVEYFKNWFMKNLISQEISNMPLNVFVLNFLNDVCGCMLSDLCFTIEEDKSLMFRQAEVLSSLESIKNLKNVSKNMFLSRPERSALPSGGVILANAAKIGKDSDKWVFPLNIKDKSIPADQIVTYQVIYMDTQSKYAHGNVAGETDDQLGIIHLRPGANYGILNDIKWKKTNTQYLRESRTMRFQGLGDYAQLANYYNVSMNMFGNFLFYPGMVVYIDPGFLIGPNLGSTLGGGSVLFDTHTKGRETTGDVNQPINYGRLMGIGGYHLITKVSAKISNGNFQTDVEARYQYSNAMDADLFRDKAVGVKKPGDIADEQQDKDETDVCNNVIQSVEAQVFSDGGSIEKQTSETNEDD